MRRRGGRPGLLGTMARTAVVASTATAVSGGMQQRAQEKQVGAEAAASAPPAPAVDAPAPAAPAPGVTSNPDFDRLMQLVELNRQGALTDAEFTAAKSRLLGL